MSEFTILAVGTGILLFEVNRQSEKEEKRLAEVEQEKKELRDQVDRLAVTLDKQSAQLNEMSKITLGLRDDLEKANKKYSGPMGFGSASDEKKVEVKEVSFTGSEEEQLRPIIKAVIKMNLHSV